MSRRSDYENLDTEPLLTPEQRRRRRQRLWAAGIATAIVVVIIIAVVAVQFRPLRNSNVVEEMKPAKESLSSGPRLTASFGSAAVVVDGAPCASVGRSILEEGGTAVDAAVAVLFCNGVYNPQSMGLGGGFFMTIYSGGQVKGTVSRKLTPMLPYIVRKLTL